MTISIDSQAFKRRLVKALLSPMLRWPKLAAPAGGYSIVLGTPWALRQLLQVNLRFVQKADLHGLDKLIIVFDRVRQEGADETIRAVRSQFPSLPLEFLFHPPVPGWIVAQVNQSKFFASLNWVTGIAHCRTKYAVMHDFDLYPTNPTMFRAIVDAMCERRLRFSGVEYTGFDGLTEQDALIGTWELGIDVEWLRNNFRPVDCFHAVGEVGGRRVDLDAFSLLQSHTPERALPDSVDRSSFAHVTNLCSTYLRYQKGEPVAVTWRLHCLWYLEYLAGHKQHFTEAIAAMEHAQSSWLTVGAKPINFADVHVTCANVLADEIGRMECALYGAVRSDVFKFQSAFRKFLQSFGNNRELPAGMRRKPRFDGGARSSELVQRKARHAT